MKVTLACKEVSGRHFAINIQHWMLEEVTNYELKPDQIFVLSVDSAANITKAVKNVVEVLNSKVAALIEDSLAIESDDLELQVDDNDEIRIEDENDEDFDEFSSTNFNRVLNIDMSLEATKVVPEILRDSSILVNCVVHKVQLAVNKFMWKDEKSTTNLINDAGKLVVMLRTPKAHVKLLAEGMKQPKVQVITRWNSVYDMLGRLIELKDFCLRSQHEEGFEKLKRSSRTWEKFEELRKVLEIPAILTKNLQAEDLLVCDFVYQWHSMMLRLSNFTSTPLIKSLIKCFKERESEIFENKLILAGWFMDKNLSLMPQLQDDGTKKWEAKKVIRMIHDKKQKLLGIFQEPVAVIQEEEEVENRENAWESPFDKMLQELGKASSSSCQKFSHTQPATKDDLEKEIESYEKMMPPAQRPTNLILWWKEKSENFPTLAPIALDIISAPVTEVSVERLFSHLKIIMNRHRSLMKADLTNDILFLRMNEKFDNY